MQATESITPGELVLIKVIDPILEFLGETREDFIVPSLYCSKNLKKKLKASKIEFLSSKIEKLKQNYEENFITKETLFKQMGKNSSPKFLKKCINDRYKIFINENNSSELSYDAILLLNFLVPKSEFYLLTKENYSEYIKFYYKKFKSWTDEIIKERTFEIIINNENWNKINKDIIRNIDNLYIFLKDDKMTNPFKYFFVSSFKENDFEKVHSYFKLPKYQEYLEKISHN